MIFTRQKNPWLSIIIIFLSLLIFIQCKSKEIRSEKPDISIGWKDDHTYIVEASGNPDKGTTGFVRRRGSAKKNAIENAKDKISRELFGKPYQEIQNPSLKKLIHSGRTIKTEYDDNDQCKLKFLIASDHLKNKTEYWKKKTTNSEKQNSDNTKNNKPTEMEDTETRTFEPDEE